MVKVYTKNHLATMHAVIGVSKEQTTLCIDWYLPAILSVVAPRSLRVQYTRIIKKEILFYKHEELQLLEVRRGKSPAIVLCHVNCIPAWEVVMKITWLHCIFVASMDSYEDKSTWITELQSTLIWILPSNILKKHMSRGPYLPIKAMCRHLQ